MRWIFWRFHHSALTQLTWSLTLWWFSWHGVSLSTNSVDGEWWGWRRVRVDEEWDSTSTELTKSETPRQISWWEWDSTSTELTKSESPHHLSWPRVRLNINWVSAEWDSMTLDSMRNALEFFEDFIILHWLSWPGFSLHVDSAGMESHSALTQLMGNETPCQLNYPQMIKNSKMSVNSRKKNRKYLKDFSSGLQRSVQKTRTKNLMQVHL